MQISLDQDKYLDETLNVLEIEGLGGAWALPKSSFGNTVICISVASGSLSEPVYQGIDGIAHFLEHRIFWRNDKDVSELFADLGIEINAYTGLTTTDFVLVGSGDKQLCAAIDLLLDLLLAPTWSLTGLEREKDIVEHELGLYQDDPEWIGYHAALCSAYGKKRIAGEIAGDKTHLALIDLHKLMHWHELFYHPSNMMIFISGNSDIDRLFNLISEKVFSFNTDKILAQCSWKDVSYEKFCPNKNSEFKYIKNISITRPQVFLLFPLQPSLFQGGELVRMEVALELALDILLGPSGLVYEKLYLSGLIGGNSLDYETEIEKDFGFVTINVETDFPSEFCDQIYDSIGDILTGDLVKTDIERARKKALGSLVRSYETSEECVELLQFAEGLGVRPSAYTNALIDVTEEEVTEVVSIFLQSERRLGALLFPHGSKLPKIKIL
jgi:predicted Zn-dependent peptidase